MEDYVEEVPFDVAVHDGSKRGVKNIYSVLLPLAWHSAYCIHIRAAHKHTATV